MPSWYNAAMTTQRQEGFIPRKLTPEFVLAFKEHIERGVDLEVACLLLSVSKETVQAWLRDGQKRRDEEPEVTVEEWVERGIYTPPLVVAFDQGMGSGYKEALIGI